MRTMQQKTLFSHVDNTIMFKKSFCCEIIVDVFFVLKSGWSLVWHDLLSKVSLYHVKITISSNLDCLILSVNA